jgi:hypothetical protein
MRAHGSLGDKPATMQATHRTPHVATAATDVLLDDLLLVRSLSVALIAPSDPTALAILAASAFDELTTLAVHTVAIVSGGHTYLSLQCDPQRILFHCSMRGYAAGTAALYGPYMRSVCWLEYVSTM